MVRIELADMKRLAVTKTVNREQNGYGSESGCSLRAALLALCKYLPSIAGGRTFSEQ
jgi:hypothetical protein